jgi:hypothetical protein
LPRNTERSEATEPTLAPSSSLFTLVFDCRCALGSVATIFKQMA